jgi:hypothetical protein
MAAIWAKFATQKGSPLWGPPASPPWAGRTAAAGFAVLPFRPAVPSLVRGGVTAVEEAVVGGEDLGQGQRARRVEPRAVDDAGGARAG